MMVNANNSGDRHGGTHQKNYYNTEAHTDSLHMYHVPYYDASFSFCNGNITLPTAAATPVRRSTVTAVRQMTL